MKWLKRLWNNRELIRFALFENRDFDYSYLYTLLDIKLTKMGKSLWNGYNVDSRKIAHSVWETRKWLRRLINDEACTDAEEITQAIFFKKYGFPMPEINLKSSGRNKRGYYTLHMFYMLPKGYSKEQRKEILTFIHSIKKDMSKTEETLRKAYKEKFFALLRDNIDFWWD